MYRSRAVCPWRLCWLAFVVLAMAGCARPGGRVAQGNRDQVFYWGNGAEPQDLDPQTDIAENDSRILYALFEGLVSQDPHDLHPIPGVAETWDISPDGRTYTFHLRHDAKWSNGDPVTSRDFIASYRRILSPKLTAQYAEYFLEGRRGGQRQRVLRRQDHRFFPGGFSRPRRLHVRHPVGESHRLFPLAAGKSALVPGPRAHDPQVRRVGRKSHALDASRQPRRQRGIRADRLEDRAGSRRPRKTPLYWDAKRVRLKAIHFYPTDNTDSEERDFRAGLLHCTWDSP